MHTGIIREWETGGKHSWEKLDLMRHRKQETLTQDMDFQSKRANITQRHGLDTETERHD